MFFAKSIPELAILVMSSIASLAASLIPPKASAKSLTPWIASLNADCVWFKTLANFFLSSAVLLSASVNCFCFLVISSTFPLFSALSNSSFAFFWSAKALLYSLRELIKALNGFLVVAVSSLAMPSFNRSKSSGERFSLFSSLNFLKWAKILLRVSWEKYSNSPKAIFHSSPFINISIDRLPSSLFLAFSTLFCSASVCAFVIKSAYFLTMASSFSL